MQQGVENGDAPRPQHLIITLFAIYARPREGVLSIAEIIALMTALGVDSSAVRSSVSRLKRRGLLQSTQKDGAAAYRLSDELVEVFRAGDQRIFHQQRATLDDPWLLASFTVPEKERPVRHQLRTTLARLGFGQVSGGLWIAPGLLASETKTALENAGLEKYVELFLGNRISNDPLAEAIRSWWDLPTIEAHYREFISAFEQVVDLDFAAEETFATYMHAMTQWRRLPYLDPGIPAELLPEDWAGFRAEAVFSRLRNRLAGTAEGYVSATLAAA
ncbi:PaaX family transcriptional regulator C-terminal domain-containing protein [Leucobacter denitrificans]|uniref:Transcriptional regulator n=1 Tax=Leucobacter denitrificans TaxID=683042 RepID=A0A7G9S2S9_9MICO|nr:PaaX family transcriptional regulator C-terminal domain-containing protein [Leucobacter denitrificans]QNN62154.1 transcriptional regulator [Leucobacter denitrificans]